MRCGIIEYFAEYGSSAEAVELIDDVDKLKRGAVDSLVDGRMLIVVIWLDVLDAVPVLFDVDESIGCVFHFQSTYC